MLATKNRAAGKFILSLAVTVLLAGCTPPGPRALLDGRRLLDEGQYPEAVEKFKTATVLMPTNAPAWNYLGLAYHRAGQPTNAVTAYTRALTLNRDLVEVRYNLGCLWLDENNLEAAKSEFTAYTLRRSNLAEGWRKLGAVQLRTRDANGAEKSFREALRVSAQDVEALNGLGLVQLQRNRPREAAEQFSAVLKVQPDYAPALLNLATVSQQYLNDRAGALQRYHEYLALKPQPENWEAVSLLVRSLEQPLALPPVAIPRPPATNVVAPPVVNRNTNPSKPVAVVSNRPFAQTRPTPAPVPPKPAPAASVVATTAPVQVVQVAPEPVIKTTPNDAPASAPTTKTQSVPAAAPPTTSAPKQNGNAARPGFLSRMNPVNLFREEPKPGSTNSAADASSASRGTTATPASSGPAPDSKRREAARAFAQGQQAQRAGKLTEAINAYRQATEVDPTYYEAFYNLGLATYNARSYRTSLAAWEKALALQPDSVDARFNYTLALKAADQPKAAAAELERILAANPDEVRAHLVLGNLYAEQLNDPTRARIHYTKLLELSPRHPQAAAIRYWIVANPP